MQRQFKGPRRTLKPSYNPVTPPFWGLNKRQTDATLIEDDCRRSVYGIQDTAEHYTPVGGISQFSHYIIPEISANMHFSIRTLLLEAANRHVEQRVHLQWKRKWPEIIQISLPLYQDYQLWMIGSGYDPSEGITFSTQGDGQTVQIAIQLNTTLPDNMIFCIHSSA